MKFNYITLCIFILIIILCCVTMLYQHHQKIQRYDIQSNKVSHPKLFQLIKLHNESQKNNNKVIESFESGKLVSSEMKKIWKEKFEEKKLFISHIEIITESEKKKIAVEGNNLDKIKQVFFDEIVGDIEIVIGAPASSPTVTKISDDLQQIKIIPPNLNDYRFRNMEDLDSLEMKFLIEDNESATKTDTEPTFNPYDSQTIDISKLKIPNKIFEEGYSKQVKINFKLSYFITTLQQKDENLLETNPHYYTDQALTDYEEGSENRIDALNGRLGSLKVYSYLSPEKIKCVKSFNEMCTEIKDDEKAKERPEVKKICDEKDYDFTTFYPAPSLDTYCRKYIENPDDNIKEFDEKPPIILKFNGEEYQLNEGQQSIYLVINNTNYFKESPEPINQKITIELSDTHKKIFEKHSDSIETKPNVLLENITVELQNEDTQVIIPTGIYYKPGVGKVTTDENGIKFDPKSWFAELGKKINTGDESSNSTSESGKMVNSITGFYTDTREILKDEKKDTTETKSLPIEDELKASWIKYQNPEQNAITRELEFKWDTPKQFLNEPNLDKYKYYLIFELLESVEEQNSNVITDDLKEKILEIPVLKQQDPNKMMSFKKEFNTKMSFSYDRLKPLAKYKYTFWLITNSLDGNMKIIEDDYVFKTPEMLENKYHSHLYDPVTKKFKLEMINFDDIKNKKPELLQTYYQMVAYNKRKNEDDILNSQIDMQESNKCMQANINQFKFGEIGSTFSKNLTKFITEDNLKDGTQFSIKQEKQEKQIKQIEKKLAELEKHQGKKVSLQDLQIKTLKSLQDGTLIRLEELAGEKKLVKLNEGCLAYNKKLQFGGNDDYGYIPCNSLDQEQHFKINKINNLDEYNFLLTSNLTPRIPKEEDQNKYPFYTLQPDNAEKCVSITNSKLQILPCNDSKSIKYQGFFAQDECNV